MWLIKKADEQTVMVGAIDKTNKYSVKIKVQKNGQLKIVKWDKEYGYLVLGTVFALDFSGSRPNLDVTTSTDGSATISDTNVLIKEKSVPAPYIINETPFKATVKAGEPRRICVRKVKYCWIKRM